MHIRRTYHSFPLFLLPLALACGSTGPDESSNAEAEEAISATSMDVRIKLESIYVHDEADGRGDAEPYLWPIFFKMDMDTVTNLAPNKSPLTPGNVQWLTAPSGTHGNLGGDVDDGDTIVIPANVGEQRFTLRPGLVPTNFSYVGALVVMLEEDDAPPSSAIRGIYEMFAQEFANKMRDQVICSMSAPQRTMMGYTLPSNCPPPIADPKQAIPFVERELYNTLTDNFDHWLVNVDDIIGVKMYIWTFDDLVAQPQKTFSVRWNDNNGSEDGDFELQGYAETDLSGDTCSNAATIEPTESVNLLISEKGDNDFFRVVLPKAGHLRLHTTSPAGTDTVGTLRNSSCVVIAGDDDSGAGYNFDMSRRLKAGTYYVSVRDYAHSNTGGYTLHSSFTADKHGDFGGEATAVGASSVTSGKIAPKNDVDMFEIDVTSGGNLTVYSTGSTDTIADLYGPTGIIASSDDDGAGRNFRISRGVSPGKYFVAIRTYNQATTGDYQVHVQLTTSDDHGTSCSSATTINAMSSTMGSLESGGDVDYFRVVVPSSRWLKVYTSSSIDTYGQLLDSNCNPIFADDDSGQDRNFRFHRSVGAGTYYISVRHYSSAGTGNYRLLVNPIE